MVLGVDLFFALFNNLAIFIALVGVYGYLITRLKPSPWYTRQLLVGLVFGLFAVGCMYAKIPVFTGVIVDQRNASIALSGFFRGPLAAYLSAAFAGAFRLSLGGPRGLGGRYRRDSGRDFRCSPWAAPSTFWLNTKGSDQRSPRNTKNASV